MPGGTIRSDYRYLAGSRATHLLAHETESNTRLDAKLRKAGFLPRSFRPAFTPAQNDDCRVENRPKSASVKNSLSSAYG